MYRAILFAGTSEGRVLATYLEENKIEALVCTATEYGGSLIDAGNHLTLSSRPMDESDMVECFNKDKPKLVIDATHPHAKAVTSNIFNACEKADVPYLRVIRSGIETRTLTDCIYVDSVKDAVNYLVGTEGRILVTTGSKEIEEYTKIPNYLDRVIARVLSTSKSMEICKRAGFEGSNLICMQGPFSSELNSAMMKQYDCKYLVTKASGVNGGFEDKIDAVRDCGGTAVIIGVPEQIDGVDIFEAKRILADTFNVRPTQLVSLVGIGAGSKSSMTFEAKSAIEDADLLIGAERMLESVDTVNKHVLKEYNSEKIKDYIVSNYQYERVVVILSGDSGFYSGAKKLAKTLINEGLIVKQIPGISSISIFSSKIQVSWDDAIIVSNHGVGLPLIPFIRDNEKVFSILGKPDDIANIARKLVHYGLTHVKMYIGERLSYRNEKIVTGLPEAFLDYENDPLCVVALINEKFRETEINKFSCRHDDEFIRGKVPMTKEEVRTISVDRLKLNDESICYDIGAGTGSISIEMAIKASKGMVYAIEKKTEAVELIEENKRKFMVDNLTAIEGFAPEAMDGLPAPTHLFIGGSSGNMNEIVDRAIAANPNVRVVINCIAVESISQAVECGYKYSERPEIIQIQASRGRKVGGYTLMNGENPIAIVAFGGK